VRIVLVAVIALLGFAVGFVSTFLIGFAGTVSAECDGPCFDQMNEVLLLALGMGVLAAVVFGLVTWLLASRRFANRNAKPS
jgi:hypothetical protein